MQEEADIVFDARATRAEIVNTWRRDEKQNGSLDRIGSRNSRAGAPVVVRVPGVSFPSLLSRGTRGRQI